MPMGLEIYLVSSLISNVFQFPKSFLEPTEKYEEPKKERPPVGRLLQHADGCAME